jgi:hypothetical protein
VAYPFSELPSLLDGRFQRLLIRPPIPGRQLSDTLTGHLVMTTPAGQHDDVELDFLSSHLPFCLAGMAGSSPDGDAWVFSLQLTPANAGSLVGEADDPAWVARDAIHRALELNSGAALVTELHWTPERLTAIYRGRGVSGSDIATWSSEELALGLLAECCGAGTWRHLPRGRPTALSRANLTCARTIGSATSSRSGPALAAPPRTALPLSPEGGCDALHSFPLRAEGSA